MKISKVDNVKTCVSIKGELIKGNIYQFSKKSNSTLDEYLVNRIRASKKLYNIFNLRNLNQIPDGIKHFNNILLKKNEVKI